MASPEPILNYDVLLVILRACSRPDCSRFMRTARFFYTHGMETLLSEDVELYTEEKLLRFLAYLRKPEDDSRYKYVRSLKLPYDDLSERGSLELIDALALLSHLNKLSFGDAETLLSSHRHLPDAFAALTRVRDIDMTYIGPVAARMLISLRSGLVTVDFSFYDDREDALFEILPEDKWNICHPTILLQRSCSTLEKITSYCWRMNPYIPPDHTIVYPKMRELDLEAAPFPLTLSYVRAYPLNLERLSFNMIESTEEHIRWPGTLEQLDARHSFNVAQQINSGCIWQKLRFFWGCLMDIYVLGLACPVDEVHVHSLRGSLLYMLGPTLSHVRPRRLTLLRWPGGKLDGPVDEMFSALGGRRGSRLEFLELAIDFDSKDPKNQEIDIADVLDGLLSTLRDSPLLDLKLNIGTTDLDPRPSSMSIAGEAMGYLLDDLPLPPLEINSEDYPLLWAEQAADAFDLEEYVRRFAREIPTLRHARVTLAGPRDRRREVTLDGGQLAFRESVERKYGEYERMAAEASGQHMPEE